MSMSTSTPRVKQADAYPLIIDLWVRGKFSSQRRRNTKARTEEREKSRILSESLIVFPCVQCKKNIQGPMIDMYTRIWIQIYEPVWSIAC